MLEVNQKNKILFIINNNDIIYIFLDTNKNLFIYINKI